MKTVVKNKKQTNPMLSLLGYFSALFVLFFLSEYAFAGGGEDIGGVAASVTGTLKNVQNLLVAVAYIAGIAFGIAGVMKFKAHKDNPTQVPLSQPLTLIMIAAGLMFLPSLLSTAGETIFKGGQKGSAEGGEI